MLKSREGASSVLAINKQSLSGAGLSKSPGWEECDSDYYPHELETIRSPRVKSVFFDSDVEKVATPRKTGKQGTMKIDHSRNGYIAELKAPSTPRSQEMEQITAAIDDLSTYEIPDGSACVPTGLCIVPWDSFNTNPRIFNELFHLCDKQVLYDTDEVNVFFGSSKMIHPTLGKLSDKGKSWVINVEMYDQLKWIRQWMTERCSVFTATLTTRKWFGQCERGSCLVLLDPQYGIVGEMIYANLTRALDCMRRNRKFSFEIDLNECIKRWCARVLKIRCDVTGAKLTVTNGEEKQDGCKEDGLRGLVCFPVNALQRGIYQINRSFTYEDLAVDMTNEDITSGVPISKQQTKRKSLFFGRHDKKLSSPSETAKIPTIASAHRRTSVTSGCSPSKDTVFDKTVTRYEKKIIKSVENVQIKQPCRQHIPTSFPRNESLGNRKQDQFFPHRTDHSVTRTDFDVKPKTGLVSANVRSKISVTGIGAVEQDHDSELSSSSEHYNERNIDDAIQKNVNSYALCHGDTGERPLRFYGDTSDEDTASDENDSLDKTDCSHCDVVKVNDGVTLRNERMNVLKSRDGIAECPVSSEKSFSGGSKVGKKPRPELLHTESNDSILALKSGHRGPYSHHGNITSLSKSHTQFAVKHNESTDPGIFEGLDINSKIYDKIIENTRHEHDYGIDNPSFQDDIERPLSRRNKNIDEWVFQKKELDAMDNHQKTQIDETSDDSEFAERPMSRCSNERSMHKIQRQPSDGMVFKPHPKFKRERIPENKFDDDLHVYSEDEDSQHSMRIIAVSNTQATKTVDTRELPPTTCEGKMKLGNCSESGSESDEDEPSLAVQNKQMRGIGHRRKKGPYSSRHKYLGLNDVNASRKSTKR